MRLPVLPRARLLQSLLLLTLLLVAVCRMQNSQSPEAQPRSPLWKAQGNVETEEEEQPQGTSSGLMPVNPSSLSAEGTFKPYFMDFLEFLTGMDDKALPTADFSESRPWGNEQEEDGAKTKPRMRIWEQPSSYPGVKVYSPDGDRCYKWVSCNYDFYTMYRKSLQKELPSCPCTYPAEALDGPVSLFDQRLGRTFSWKDTRDTQEHKHGKHPSAGLCLRSLWEETSSIPASQLCCYESSGRLLTRGKGAGSPELISPDYAPELYFLVDYAPWEFCKGNWSVLHILLPPDNGLSCPERPSKDKYEAQLKEFSK